MKKPSALSVRQSYRLSHIAGSGNYSTLHFKDGTCELFSYTLLRYELAFPTFIRVHKRFLVNPNMITRIDKEARQIELRQGILVPISRRRLNDIINQFDSHKNNS